MDFTNPVFIVSTLTGIAYVLSALLMRFKPPQKINEIYGYRSKRAKQSEKHWHFAQTYSAKIMLVVGLLMILMGLGGLFLPIAEDGALQWPGFYLALVVMFLLMFIPIYFTEKALKAI